MTEHDTTLATDHDTSSQLPPAFGGPDAIGDRIAGTLTDLESILSAAKLTQLTVSICLDGALVSRHGQLTRELAGMTEFRDGKLQVIDNGDEEQSLADQGRAEEISEELRQVERAMRQVTAAFTFEAMPSDEWSEFSRTNRDTKGNLKSPEKFFTALIARCSVTPDLDVDDVVRLAKKLNHAQMEELRAAAFNVNASEGISAPKSPSYLRGLKLQE